MRLKNVVSCTPCSVSRQSTFFMPCIYHSVIQRCHIYSIWKVFHKPTLVLSQNRFDLSFIIIAFWKNFIEDSAELSKRGTPHQISVLFNRRLKLEAAYKRNPQWVFERMMVQFLWNNLCRVFSWPYIISSLPVGKCSALMQKKLSYDNIAYITFGTLSILTTKKK